MTTVVVSITNSAAIPTRLEGHVVTKKDGSVNIAYKEKGQIKESNRSFLASEIVGSLAGEAGYVIALLNEPVAKVVGELSIKDGVRHVKTDTGTVVLNAVPGILYDVKEVEADSKEARAAERASKVKVRPSKASREAARAAEAKPAKGGKTSSREERLAAKKAARAAEAAPVKKAKKAVVEEAPVKKKSRRG
jgi:hypothetical protein